MCSGRFATTPAAFQLGIWRRCLDATQYTSVNSRSSSIWVGRPGGPTSSSRSTWWIWQLFCEYLYIYIYVSCFLCTPRHTHHIVNGYLFLRACCFACTLNIYGDTPCHRPFLSSYQPNQFEIKSQFKNNC